MSDSEHHHIDPAELGAYLEGALPDPERAALEDHLADCRACREELVVTASLVRGAAAESVTRVPTPTLRPEKDRGPTPSSGRRFKWWWLGAAATAAVAAFLLLMPPTSPEMGATGNALRNTGGAGDALRTLPARPPNISLMPEGLHLTLAWDPVPGDVTYRLTVTGEDGAALRTMETTERSVTLEPIEGVERGDHLFWYADVTLPNGESATTGLQRLVVP